MKIEMNIANKITIFRIVAIPVFLAVVYADASWSNIIATIIFTVASFSDLLDGYLARKYDLVTDMGKVIDPVADKIFVAAALIALVQLQRLEGWIVIVMLARDFSVGALRDLSASKGVIIPAGIWGKVKTTLQMIAIGMLTYYDTLLGINFGLLGTVMVYIAVIASIYSAYVYFKEYKANLD